MLHCIINFSKIKRFGKTGRSGDKSGRSGYL
nr:MAG TPA: hypothetical protein [Caudoviricetes sp.]